MGTKKFGFSILIVCCITVSLFLPSSCSLFGAPEESILSNMIPGEQIPTLNSDTVGIVWDKNKAETNITQDHAGFVVGAEIADPCVVKKDGIYHIWFTATSKAGTYTIRYAESADGKIWKNDNASNIALAPTESEPAMSNYSDDEKGVRIGSVLWDPEAKEYKMWYRGQDKDGKWRVLFARSTNPITGWIKHPNTYISPEGDKPKHIMGLGAPGVSFDSDNIGDVSVIKKSYFDGYETSHCYEMWYSAVGSKAPVPPNPDPARLGDPKYRILYAKSSDGLDWSDKVLLPVLVPDDKGFDFTRKDLPAVLYDSYKGSMIYKLWYIGEKDSAPEQKLGLASGYSGEALDYYNPDTFEEGIPDFPYPEAPANCTVEVKDPWVIRDGFMYKMWYVVNISDKDTGTVISSKIHYVESW